MSDRELTDTEIIDALERLTREYEFVANPAGFSFNRYGSFPTTYTGSVRKTVTIMLGLVGDKKDST